MNEIPVDLGKTAVKTKRERYKTRPERGMLKSFAVSLIASFMYGKSAILSCGP
jgi:hypothetical protein